MISLILMTGLFFLLSIKDLESQLQIWSHLAYSYFFSTAILGGVVLIIGSVDGTLSNVSVLHMVCFSWVISLSVLHVRNRLFPKWSLFIDILKELFSSFSSFPNGIKIFLALILLASIGPINHPDAADYHVGYAFQAFLKGRIINDGGLHLGLVGLGDWAHLAFLQDHTQWLIRTAQALILIPAAGVLLEYKTGKWHVLTLLSAPVMLQWVTIGKPLLMTDATLAILFINVLKSPDKSRLLQLIHVSLLSLAFKISSLLIAVPLSLMALFIYNRKSLNRKRNMINMLDMMGLIALITLCSSVFIFRYSVYTNPFYPFLTSYITPERLDIIAYADQLLSYGKVHWSWPVDLFIPRSMGALAFVIGPVILLNVILRIYVDWKNRHYSLTLSTGLLLIILLLFFGQGRADYFFSPFFIIIIGSSVLSENYNLNRLIKSFIFIQLMLTGVLLLINIGQSLHTFIRPVEAMQRYAYGFSDAQAARDLPKPTLFLSIRQTRLYFDQQYVDRDRFKTCLMNLSPDECLQLFSVQSIIVSPNDTKALGIIDNPSWICQDTMLVKRGSRNPFNYSEVLVQRWRRR